MVSKKSFSAVLATLVILSVIAGTSITSAQTAVVTTQNTIVMTAQETPTLSDLVKYLNATNLTAALNDTTKNYTVFAPDNAAFDKLGNKTLADLANNTTKLATILKSHVVVGKVNLTANGTTQTLAGNTIAWNTTANVTKVQLPGGTNATVKQANITTSNGVVNVIDTVLVPGAGVTTGAVASAAASAAGGFLGLPGFEALYAVVGLLAVAYLVMRRRK
ncbi:MAG: fasciclin domain-containing protein [Halobacteriota archaeon]